MEEVTRGSVVCVCSQVKGQRGRGQLCKTGRRSFKDCINYRFQLTSRFSGGLVYDEVVFFASRFFFICSVVVCWTLFGVLGLDSLLAGTYLFGGRGSVENMKVSWLLWWNGKWSKGRFLTLVARRVRETRSLAGSPWGGVSRGCDVVVAVSPCLFVCRFPFCVGRHIYGVFVSSVCVGERKKPGEEKKERMKLVKAPPLVEDSSTHKKLRSQLNWRCGIPRVSVRYRLSACFTWCLRDFFCFFLQAFFFSGLSCLLFTLFLRDFFLLFFTSFLF